VSEYLEQFYDLERNYFDAYAYDTIWSLAYLSQTQLLMNETNIKRLVDNIDFIGATVRRVNLNEEIAKFIFLGESQVFKWRTNR
jgi:hypothetical protein